MMTLFIHCATEGNDRHDRHTVTTRAWRKKSINKSIIAEYN